MTKEQLKKMSKDEIFNFIRKELKFENLYSQSIRNEIDYNIYDELEDYIKIYNKNIDNSKEIKFKIRKPTERNEHLRFDMSGYESENGKCTIDNQFILNKFAYLGIYDYTDYLFLDFYKGCGTLYYKYFSTDENKEENFGGYGTTEIIYEIFKRTILTDKYTRRRN